MIHLRKYEEFQEEVVKVPISELHLLALMPLCVQVIRIMPPPPDHTPEGDQFAWLHVRTPYSPVRTPNTQLSYSPLHEFLERLRGLMKSDLQKIDTAQITTGVPG